MSGVTRSGGGHTRWGLQSKSVGHSTLKPKSMLRSCGSKFAGGLSFVGEATKRSVYVEKSPATAVRTTSVLAPSARAPTIAAVAASPGAASGAGSGEAGAAHVIA